MNHKDTDPRCFFKEQHGRSRGFVPSPHSPYFGQPPCAVRPQTRAAGFSLRGACGLLLSHEGTRMIGPLQPSRWDLKLRANTSFPASKGGARGSFCAFGTRLMHTRRRRGARHSFRLACFRCAEDMAPGSPFDRHAAAARKTWRPAVPCDRLLSTACFRCAEDMAPGGSPNKRRRLLVLAPTWWKARVRRCASS